MMTKFNGAIDAKVRRPAADRFEARCDVLVENGMTRMQAIRTVCITRPDLQAELCREATLARGRR